VDLALQVEPVSIRHRRVCSSLLREPGPKARPDPLPSRRTVFDSLRKGRL